MKEFVFKYEMEVRDYECDLQGIVNKSMGYWIKKNRRLDIASQTPAY